jgi:hypothetical protein
MTDGASKKDLAVLQKAYKSQESPSDSSPESTDDSMVEEIPAPEKVDERGRRSKRDVLAARNVDIGEVPYNPYLSLPFPLLTSISFHPGAECLQEHH